MSGFLAQAAGIKEFIFSGKVQREFSGYCRSTRFSIRVEEVCRGGKRDGKVRLLCEKVRFNGVWVSINNKFPGVHVIAEE